MLDKLIEEGVAVRQSCYTPKSTYGGDYLSGEAYETWIAKCIFYVEENSKSATLTQRFLRAAENASGNGPEHYNTMMGVLKALKEFGNE